MLEYLKENPLIEDRIEILNNFTSCIYCGIKTEEVLVQCGQCDHKFCNGISEYINNSHILNHFEKANHNTIKYPKKKFNEELYCDNKNMEIISCGYCDENNIYKIFFYKDEKNKKIQFLCENHLNKKIEEAKYKDKIFFKENYKKLIYTSKNKKDDTKYLYISPLLVEIPSKLEDINLLSNCDINTLNSNEEIIQQMDYLTQNYLNKVKYKYFSSKEYYAIYKPLINSEWTYTKKIFEMKPEFKIDLYYSKKEQFYFYIDDKFDSINFCIEKRLQFSQEMNLMKGLFNILDEEEKNERIMPINFVGIIIDIIHIKKDCCKIIKILPIREDLIETIKNNLGKYYIKENFCDVPYIRMLIGLEDFYFNKRDIKNNNYTSNLIFSQILGIIEESQLKDLENNELKEIFNENKLITNIDNFGELNTSQRKCLSKIFSNTLNMIQGPPGTGKTFLASFIIYNILQKRKDTSDKILVCAPSNSAADNLAQYLINLMNSLNLEKEEKEKMRILRVYPKGKDHLENNTLNEINLYNKIKIVLDKYKKKKLEEKYIQENYESIKFNNLDSNLNDYKENTINSLLSENMNDTINWDYDDNYLNNDYLIQENKNFEEDNDNILITRELINKFAKYIINDHNIIISTCSTSYDEKLLNINFKYILIDEATQCCEIESLLPILHGSRFLVMIGDQKQLGPTIIYPKADLFGMKISLFERMIKLYPNNYYMLKKQYRMSPELVSFSSNFFYEGKIKNSSRHQEKENKYIKKILNKFYWANKDIPILFINTNNKSTYKYNKFPSNNNDIYQSHFTSESNIGKSYQNELEANITIKILNILNSIKSLKKGKYSIGIITPYIGQKKLLLEKLIYDDNNNNIPYIDCIKNNIINIASVDSFQGKEKDFIIINTVRSNYKNIIGFLKDAKRLNVSLTRARHGLIIIGDAYCLSKSIGEKDNKFSIWRYLIKYYQNKGIIVDYIDNEKDEKMFKPTKIIDENEELKEYEFNEYDFDGKDNKPLHINDDNYMDDFSFFKNKYFEQHYIYDNDFLNYSDEEFINEFFYKNEGYDRYNIQENI